MTVTTDSGTPLSPQPRLRIVANYYAGKIGDFEPLGQPENVEIEISDPLPADLAGFVDSLLASLFQHGPATGLAGDVTDEAAAPVVAGTGGRR